MKVLHNIYVSILVLIVSLCLFGYGIFHYQISGIGGKSLEKEVVIEKGGISSIADTLKQEGLIRNTFFFKLYCKLYGKNSLKAGAYRLNTHMGVEKIVEVLTKGKGINPNQISITFKEGFNMMKFIQIITSQTNIKEEDIINTLKDKEYLNSLIQDYWFLTDDILNDKIYYSLEGYLYPNTYFFDSKEISIQDVISTMLDETKKQLSPYQEKIQQSEFNVHEVMTLASIVELEGVHSEDRKGIASVFINRIDKKMTLGSDVTTYYGARISMGDRDLYASEVKECNSYNTRCASFLGLPVSPIDNPSVDSISAVLDPISSDYYYFVADKNKKVYFSKNINEHNNTISKLKKQGLWFEY